MNVKHQMLDAYLSLVAEQVSLKSMIIFKERKQFLRKTESNDIVYCIKNSIVKHCGVDYAQNFDVQKA